MPDPVILKSKSNLATKVALAIALVLLVVVLLVVYAGANLKAWAAVLMAVAICAILIKKRMSQPIDHYAIVQIVADTHYKHTHAALDTRPVNIRTSPGAVDETYVQFIKEVITFMYRKGEGVVSVEPGRTIEIIKRDQQSNKIALKMADIGMSQERTAQRLNTAGARSAVDTQGTQTQTRTQRSNRR